MCRTQSRWPPHIRKLEPTRAWEVLSVKEEARVLPLGPLQQPGPKPPGTVRFVCVSDTHSAAPRHPLPEGDCLIHAGDFTDTGRPQELEAFCAWLKAQPHRRKIVIAGSHTMHMEHVHVHVRVARCACGRSCMRSRVGAVLPRSAITQ